jgi:tetratricopeptide (TPR) repeat protein
MIPAIIKGSSKHYMAEDWMSIFLSYRRADSAHALWLYPWLIQWFGHERVFWDRKDIDPGADLANVIEPHIRSSKAFVALVSHNWLSATDEQGQRRIDSPDDWIHRETALALREGLLVVPVLVGGMKAPRAQDLPKAVQKFATLHMLSMADMCFHDLLRESLENVVPSGVQGHSHSHEETLRLHRRASSLLRRQIQRLQVRAVELIQDRKLDRATEELHEGSDLLMALLDLLPGDTALDAQLGYLFGTTGQAFHAAGDVEQTDRYLDLAMSVFERVKANPALFHERPLDIASAIKGIGGVYYERGDPVAAIQHYRTALEIDPLYCYAWHDLFLAYHELARRGTINLAAMQEAIDKTRETGAGLPGLGADKFKALEHLLRGWQQRVAQHPRLEAGAEAGSADILRGLAKDQAQTPGQGKAGIHQTSGETSVRVVPQFLSLVIAESDPCVAMFNLNCDIINAGSARVSVWRLEAELTTPESRQLRFTWHVFYEFRPANMPARQMMTKTSEAHKIELEPETSCSLGIQFLGPALEPQHLWVTGEYTVELHGWVTQQSGHDYPHMKTQFRAEIGAFEANQVRYWFRATKFEWDQLQDPDRAASIPVRIDRSSIVTMTKC